jgi:hypothetical protein
MREIVTEKFTQRQRAFVAIPGGVLLKGIHDILNEINLADRLAKVREDLTELRIEFHYEVL